MNHTIANISFPAIAFQVCLLGIPLFIMNYLNLRKQMITLLVSVSRMIVQLLFIGVYLGFVFKINNMFLNLVWIMIMVLIADITILQRNNMKARIMLPWTLLAYSATILSMILVLSIVLGPSRMVNARYIIPLAGMLMGNLMNSNTVAFDRFYRQLYTRSHEYQHYLLLGASPVEAIKPFLREAYRASLTPRLNNMATVGLVSLPGMLTGQVLGGADIQIAIKYEIMTMVVMFLSSSLSNFFGLKASIKSSIDSMNRLRDIYKSNTVN